MKKYAIFFCILLFIACTAYINENGNETPLVDRMVEFEFQIESNTRWIGSFGGRTIDGYGDMIIPMGKHYYYHTDEARAQKETEKGFLRLEAVRDGEAVDWSWTYEEYGQVYVRF